MMVNKRRITPHNLGIENLVFRAKLSKMLNNNSNRRARKGLTNDIRDGIEQQQNDELNDSYGVLFS